MLSAGHWRPDLRRSVRLLADFRHEQDDPRRFYSALAADSIGQLSGYLDLAGSTVLDVGGGPGYFRDAFERAGATYWAPTPTSGSSPDWARSPAAPSSATG